MPKTDWDKLEVCSKLRFALDQFEDAKNQNADHAAIVQWQKEVERLTDLLQTIDRQERAA